MSEFAVTEFIFHIMLIFTRVAAILSRLPAIGSEYILNRAKLLFAFSVSIIIYPILKDYLPGYSQNHLSNLSYLFIEFLIGMIVSIAANIYLLSIHFIGQTISMQSGLAAASFFDPRQRSQTTLFSNFLLLAVMVFIFANDIHHLYVKAIISSYETFYLGVLPNIGDVSDFVAHVVNDSFVLSFYLVSPFIVVSLAILVGSGILSRLMPNLQVFFVITPAQILIMLGTLYIVINVMLEKISKMIMQHLYNML